MFKYLVVLALAVVAVFAAPPAPVGPAPKGDLQTASQLLYGYGAYPSVYSAGVYPAYSSYAYSNGYYPYSGVYYG